MCLLLETHADRDKNTDNFYDSGDYLIGENINSDLQICREQVKNYYFTYNEKVAYEIGITNYNYCSSYYSPYIEIVFDNIVEYIENEQSLLYAIDQGSEKLLSGSNYLIYKSNKESNVSSREDSEPYKLEDAFIDIGVNNSQYSGEGILVGVLDAGIPNSVDNLKEGKYNFLSTHMDAHATMVTSIIGGTSGIAENVYFYCMELTGIVDGCNRLINDYNVNIINLSMAVSRYPYGYYTNYDACIDKIVEESNCTIVVSAGNRGESDKIITAPGCSFNAITVGATNNSKNVAYLSSWDVDRSYLYKPDVVAPGDYLCNIGELPNVHDGNLGYSGTSCAAPMVTGTIALLMEEFPILKNNATLVKSILHLGAIEVPTQNTYFDEQAGFGLVNYQNMRECLLNCNYSDFNISSNAVAGNIVFSQTISCDYCEIININANLMINSNSTDANNAEKIPYYTDYAIKLYDCELERYVAISVIDSTIDYLNYVNMNENSLNFRIDIVLVEDNVTGCTGNGSLAFYSVHNHSYTYDCVISSSEGHDLYCACGTSISEQHESIHECDQCGYYAHSYTYAYINFSSMGHYAVCSCGSQKIESHTMDGHECTKCDYNIHSYTDHYGYYNNLQHWCYCSCDTEPIAAKHVLVRRPGGGGIFVLVCNICGYVSGGTGTLNSIPSDYPHTENGSYILPIGVIVLVPEDEEAYLNGTLEFRTGEIM